MEDQHKEPEPEPEGDKLKEPTDQRQEEEEEEAGNPGELSDRRKEEEEEEPASPEEPMDQPKEKEEPEVVNSGELTDRRKAEEEAAKEKEAERSSDQGSMVASSPCVHPCSQLLQFVARACAWCLGMPDSLDDGGATRPAAAPAASLTSSREVRVAAVNKASGSTGFYMPEKFTGVLVQLRRLQPGSNNPREGRGGNGGVHH